MVIPAHKALDEQGLWASAPCRIDAGGTWDIKAMAFPFVHISPTTVNIAIDLRTTVYILPFDKGWLRVEAEGMGKPQVCPSDHVPLRGKFALIYAPLLHFGINGARVVIRSEAPVKASLGGSSAAVVALLKAISKCMRKAGQKALTSNQILTFAYHFEDAISGGNCGLQDHAAAVFGGVNQWIWHYQDHKKPYKKIRLLSPQGEKALSQHLLVAYTGTQHISSQINRKWVRDFLAGQTRPGWLEANKITHRLADRIKRQDWAGAAICLREEMAIRRRITPEALTKKSAVLISEAESLGCGARFTGAGAGGCIWAIGELEKISRLKVLWAKRLKKMNGYILDCSVDWRGVR
ncbi:MAG TPA: hypothetical protein EYP06_03290 [Desulfobacterales bacterium]|nr:hypothetical protein [Desulfobacterales bacterium]